MHIPELLRSKPDLVQDISSSYQFNLSGDGGGSWYIDLTRPGFEVKPGALANPGVTVTMSADDFVDLSFGRLNPQLAFMTGKLKVRGDLGLALKLQKVITQSNT